MAGCRVHMTADLDDAAAVAAQTAAHNDLIDIHITIPTPSASAACCLVLHGLAHTQFELSEPLQNICRTRVSTKENVMVILWTYIEVCLVY